MSSFKAGDIVETVQLHELAIGDVVLVRPGARVPADGTIASGSALLDESMITGESRPVRRDEGDRVVAGTVSTDSAIRVEITALGDDTALAGIQRMVASAQQSRSRAQALADRAAAALFDSGKPCGEEANTAKLLATEAAWHAAEACMQTFGGFAAAREYDIERKWREVRISQIAPISTNLILAYLGQHVLGMPKSY